MIYPAIRTILRSLWSNQGNKFVWFQNYSTMFGDSVIHTAIKNNIIWIAVGPLSVTLFGLVLGGADRAHRLGELLQDRPLSCRSRSRCSRSA